MNFSSYGHLNIDSFYYTIESGALVWVDKNVTEVQNRCEYDFSSDAKEFIFEVDKIFLPNINAIKYRVFENCKFLKEVCLPDVYEIGYKVFSNCELLEKVILPETLTYVSNNAFENCGSLKNIIFGKKLTDIFGEAFLNCKSLEEIDFPSSLETIYKDAFYGYNSLKKMIFHYECYQKLLEFLTKNKYKLRDIDSMIFRNTLPNFDFFPVIGGIDMHFKQVRSQGTHGLFFVGPKLTFFQRQRLKRKIGSLYDCLVFVNDEKEFVVDKVEEMQEEDNQNLEKVSYDDDIQKVLDEIYQLCDMLPDSSKRIILDEVDQLLDDYSKDINELNPQYGREWSMTFTKNISLLKPTLLSKLEIIVLNLSSEKKLIELLSTLSGHKKLLDSNIDRLPKDNVSIENKIKTILYLSKNLNDERKEDVTRKLNE